MKRTKIKAMLWGLMLFPTIADAQLITVDDRFWVISSQNDSEKGENGKLTRSEELNTTFQAFNVTSYEKVFPFAKTEGLQKVYEVSCDCEIDDLITSLNENHAELFSGMRTIEYENISMYEPIDWLWVSQQDGWLWQLKKIEAQKAWDITHGDPNVKVAVLDTDFDITHPDLATKIIPGYDPYDNAPYDCSTFNHHGTAVASYIAGETTEIGGTSNGQLASVGFNTTMIAYKAWAGNYLQRALHASTVMNADILTSSAGGWTSCPDGTGIEQMVVKEILDNGTTIIMPAGNGAGTHNFCAAIDPVHHTAFFPLSPYYDERIILVTSSGSDDRHQFGGGTHSHYPMVDLCSPGYNTFCALPTDCGANTWPYSGGANGTSFATPIVAGVAALMYSVNPCITPSICQDILKHTTDPIIDAANFPNGVGTGRVNAYNAVRVAQEMHSTTLDLYMKDRLEDFGNETYPYHWQADRDESPDIWVRNQDDGYVNQTHEEPEYQVGQPVYVYVKVRNKSCVDAVGTEKVKLYWSKASGWSSWPQNWDGTDPTVGNLIGSIDVGDLPAGMDSVYRFVWTILDPYVHQNWASCLMARIENSPVDVITIHPGRLDDDVFFNNSVTCRNVTVIDIAPGIKPVGNIESVYHPHGKYMYIGNVYSSPETYDFSFSTPQWDQLAQSAEIKMIFDAQGWAILKDHLLNDPRVKVLREREILVNAASVFLNDVEFPANVRIPVFVGFSFLVDSQVETNNFEFHVRQYLSEEDALLGGEHFKVRKVNREPFSADAGEDVEIILGNSVSIEASDIGEGAIYNWYNSENQFVMSGKTLIDTPIVNTTYHLEVISLVDGFKDYDEVEVSVKSNRIELITPNPASGSAVVSYKLEPNVTVAELKVFNQNATVSYSYQLNTNKEEYTINLGSYPTGSYTVVLICDGVTEDNKTLVVF